MVFASELDALRAALGYPAKKITPAQLAASKEIAQHAPLTGELEANDLQFKHVLKQIAEELLPQPPRIAYNPGSGEHVRLAEAFKSTRTIFVDVDGKLSIASFNIILISLIVRMNSTEQTCIPFTSLMNKLPTSY